MTNENNEVEEQEVETEVTEEETQEVAEESGEGESTGDPSEEGEAESVKAEKEKAQAGFWQRQQQRKEETERLRLENERISREREHFRQLAEQRQAQPTRSAPQLLPLENFETETEWLYANMQALKEQEQRQGAVKAKTQTYEQKLNEYKQVSKDIYAYEQEVAEILKDTGRLDIADAIMESDKAAQIVEAIALDPTKIEPLLNARSAYGLGAGIARLESSLIEKPSISNAPKPKKLPKGEPTQSTSRNPVNMSKAEYFEMRRKQLQGK